MNKFLPICRQDIIDRNWSELDFIIVTGDAYVDHHSFGTAIISRVLENAGYKVGVIAQPNWKDTSDFMKLGKPRLGFLVNSGNMDSMVNHYSVSKRRREKDLYSPNGQMGLRPDRAVVVYCNKIREAYKNVPIIIGGVEASLRRFAHYDYWSNSIRKSILIDSSADLLIYGMGEKQVVAVANALNDGFEAKYVRYIPGTCYVADSLDEIYDDYIQVPSYKEICDDKIQYAKAFKLQYDEQDPIRGRVLVQNHSGKYLVQNIPQLPLNRDELDEVYALPYTKEYHPTYEKQGGIPAIEEVKFSLVSARGCFGSCSFCAITFHQGRIVQSRSEESILEEATQMTQMKDFKGYIHDVGGPTANFRYPACDKQLKVGACKDKQCLYPNPCKNMRIDHKEYLSLLRKLRKVPNVKKVFVRSGLRYDYIMADKNETFLKELIEHHVSGQLKVAPEHTCSKVLKYMGKPAGKTYGKFTEKFNKITNEVGKKQYIIPYLMSSHPGSDLSSAIRLAEYLRDIHYQPEQVQDFYPTPGTLSTTMFYTGLNPLTMTPVYVPKSKEEKAMQRALLQYRNPKNYDLVHKALTQAEREDLIGYDSHCLIKPKSDKFSRYSPNNNQSSKTKSTNGKFKKSNSKPRNSKFKDDKPCKDTNAKKPFNKTKSETSSKKAHPKRVSKNANAKRNYR